MQNIPQFAVSKWIGHSITVSRKHYANAVPDELFKTVAKAGGTEPAQNQAQYPANKGKQSGNNPDTDPKPQKTKPYYSMTYRTVRTFIQSGLRDSNPRPSDPPSARRLPQLRRARDLRAVPNPIALLIALPAREPATPALPATATAASPLP